MTGTDIVALGEFGVVRRMTVPAITKGEATVPVIEENTRLYGSPVYLAMALSRLGLDTGVIGPLGTDLDSGFVQGTLSDAGVDVSNLVAKRGRVAQRLLVTDGAESITLLRSGTGDDLQLGDVNLSTVEGARYIYLGAATGEKQLWLQKQLISGLVQTRLVLNLVDHRDRGMEEIRAILQRCDVVFTDEPSLEAATGQPYPDGASSLIEEGVRTVAVLLGEGAALVDRNGEHLSRVPIPLPGQNNYEAFMAGVLFGLFRDEAVDMCAELGCRMAALHGSREDGGFPGQEELMESMNAAPAGLEDVDFVAEP